MSVDNILSALTVSSENALHEEGLYDRGQGSVERARGFADFRFLKSFFEESETGEAVDYAKTILDGESKIVNWADAGERDQFLRERRTIAESVTD